MPVVVVAALLVVAYIGLATAYIPWYVPWLIAASVAGGVLAVVAALTTR